MKKQNNTKAQLQKQAKQNPQRKQISVTLSTELRVRFREACEIQEHGEGQLARILIEWALPFYERTRSVEALKYLAMKHFTALTSLDKPLEQQENDLSLIAVGGR